MSICFSLHNKDLGIILSDMKHTATDSTDKIFIEREKFIFMFCWKIYNGLGISIKFTYAARGLQALYLAWYLGNTVTDSPCTNVRLNVRLTLYLAW
jgi:hypothetical protein